MPVAPKQKSIILQEKNKKSSTDLLKYIIKQRTTFLSIKWEKQLRLDKWTSLQV